MLEIVLILRVIIIRKVEMEHFFLTCVAYVSFRVVWPQAKMKISYKFLKWFSNKHLILYSLFGMWIAVLKNYLQRFYWYFIERDKYIM